MKKRQILVIGDNESGCTPESAKLAYEIGSEIARSDSVLITGGLGGVVKYAKRCGMLDPSQVVEEILEKNQ